MSWECNEERRKGEEEGEGDGMSCTPETAGPQRPETSAPRRGHSRTSAVASLELIFTRDLCRARLAESARVASATVPSLSQASSSLRHFVPSDLHANLPAQISFGPMCPSSFPLRIPNPGQPRNASALAFGVWQDREVAVDQQFGCWRRDDSSFAPPRSAVTLLRYSRPSLRSIPISSTAGQRLSTAQRQDQPRYVDTPIRSTGHLLTHLHRRRKADWNRGDFFNETEPAPLALIGPSRRMHATPS